MPRITARTNTVIGPLQETTNPKIIEKFKQRVGVPANKTFGKLVVLDQGHYCRLCDKGDN